MVWFLLVIGVYGCAVMWVHWLHRREQAREQERMKHTRIVFLTQNSGSQIEWYLFIILWYSKVKGETVTIDVFDDASVDDTREVIRRMMKDCSFISLHEMADMPIQQWPQSVSREQSVIIRLYSPGDCAMM